MSLLPMATVHGFSSMVMVRFQEGTGGRDAKPATWQCTGWVGIVMEPQKNKDLIGTAKQGNKEYKQQNHQRLITNHQVSWN